MIERPILFSGEMVRAILAGRKTQTRRVIWAIRRVTGCPYGEPGDRLWVRERFYVQPELWAEGHGPQPVEYAADVADPRMVEDYVGKPSIHMPRWASRITLEITGRRMQRVQDISEADAAAEGVGSREEFAALWDAINVKRGYAWVTNPLVWVIEFKRAEG